MTNTKETKLTSIVVFARDILNKHLFDYEYKILLNYEELRTWASYTEWIKPTRVDRQYLYNIWLQYQEYLNGTLDLEATLKVS